MTTTPKTPAIDVSANVSSMVLSLTFNNGEIITLSADDLSNDIRNQCLLHGLKQKLVDAAAISRNPDTGRSATIDDKYQAVREVYDRLLSGQWNKTRGDGTGTGSGGLLFRALCLHYPTKTAEAIRSFLDKKTAAEKTALRNVPAIAAIIATLKVDSSEVDTDALLDELN